MTEVSKKNRLLTSAYKLFVTKGFNKTTIQDIVDAAKVAKGTFYLYFEDKYKLQEELIINKSEEIFSRSIIELSKKNIEKFDDRVIFIVDYIIDVLVAEPAILNFISKDLSLGVYQEKISKFIGEKETKLYDMFINEAKKNNVDKPDITLFMIVEFVSSTIYSVITRRIDITIDDYKKYIHSVVENMLNIK